VIRNETDWRDYYISDALTLQLTQVITDFRCKPGLSRWPTATLKNKLPFTAPDSWLPVSQLPAIALRKHNCPPSTAEYYAH
jgi:hypothetical protein